MLAAAATFFAAVVAVLLIPAPALLLFGLKVLTVELLTTTLLFVLLAAAVVVFLTGALLNVAVFFVPTARVGFVITVPLDEVVLWFETLLRMLVCEVVRWGERVGILVALALVLVSVASAGRGGGSIFPVGEPGIVVPSPVNVPCSFSRDNGRANFAPAAA